MGDSARSEARLGQAAAQGRALQRRYEGACDALGRKLRTRGRIKDLDDSYLAPHARLRQEVRLAHSRLGNDVAAGSVVTIDAHKTDDGPDLVDAVGPADAPGKLSAELSPCMELRIAPFQSTFDPTPESPPPSGLQEQRSALARRGQRHRRLA